MEFPIVTLAVGDAYADVYIARLHAMLRRQLARPHRLFCYSDRARQVPEGVELRDCAGWTDVQRAGMRPTTRKIRFFDAAEIPFETFLYLDLTLVIARPLDELLDAALAQKEALVVVQDWFYPSYNSCVMRIRRGPLEAVYRGFASGETYPHRIAGDQDFLHAAVAAHGLQHEVALFPEGQIVSYKGARRLNRTDPQAAKALIEGATIVKFHGTPKPDQVLNPLYNFFRIGLKSRADARFWRRELRQHWTGAPP
ncbi:MAG TPA: hypothetical protein VF627_08865 [Abditibacterium sp.]|jgi:hypothetical protein